MWPAWQQTNCHALQYVPAAMVDVFTRRGIGELSTLYISKRSTYYLLQTAFVLSQVKVDLHTSFCITFQEDRRTTLPLEPLCTARVMRNKSARRGYSISFYHHTR